MNEQLKKVKKIFKEPKIRKVASKDNQTKPYI